MIFRGEFLPAALWLGLCGLSLGCQNGGAGSSYGPPSGCVVEAPCEDDPAKTCTVPCDSPVAGPGGYNVGGGGSAGSSGTGGSGGVVSVDVSGTIVQFTTPVFDEAVPYLEAVQVSAVGAATKTVQADAVDGSFFLAGALAGPSWLHALDVGGAGEVFSTYSYQFLDGVTPVTLPLVPVAVLDGVAAQIGVDSLATGRAQVVLQIADEADQVLLGVEVAALAETTVGYDVAMGQFSTLTDGTGELGLALLLNAPVPGSGTVTTIYMTYLDEAYEAQVPLAANTVTYARLALDTTP